MESESYELISKARRALLVEKKKEQVKIGMGYRFYRISPQLQIFIPCDKTGKPTQEGMERIEKAKNKFGII